MSTQLSQEILVNMSRKVMNYKPEVVKDCIVERKDFAAFLANLKANSVDLVLTDPPYTISRKTGFANV